MNDCGVPWAFSFSSFTTSAPLCLLTGRFSAGTICPAFPGPWGEEDPLTATSSAFRREREPTEAKESVFLGAQDPLGELRGRWVHRPLSPDAVEDTEDAGSRQS